MDSTKVKGGGNGEWRENLSIGIPELDEDHREFFAMAHDLDQAIINRKEKAEIGQLLDLMVEHSVRHFEHEESRFAQHGYPDAARHAGVHEQITYDLTAMKRKFDAATFGAEWTGKALQIRQLLMDHCLREIEKSRNFLRDRRPTP